MTKKTKIKTERGKEGIKGENNKGKSMFGFCIFHLQFCDPRNRLRVSPVSSGLSTTFYVAIQLKFGTTET